MTVDSGLKRTLSSSMTNTVASLKGPNSQGYLEMINHSIPAKAQGCLPHDPLAMINII